MKRPRNTHVEKRRDGDKYNVDAGVSRVGASTEMSASEKKQKNQNIP